MPYPALTLSYRCDARRDYRDVTVVSVSDRSGEQVQVTAFTDAAVRSGSGDHVTRDATIPAWVSYPVLLVVTGIGLYRVGRGLTNLVRRRGSRGSQPVS